MVFVLAQALAAAWFPGCLSGVQCFYGSTQAMACVLHLLILSRSHACDWQRAAWYAGHCSAGVPGEPWTPLAGTMLLKR